MNTEISHPILELERTGATITVKEGTIRVNNPAGLKPELVDELRRRKHEALVYLAQRDRNADMPADDPYSSRLRKALLATLTPDYPMALLPWLDVAYHAMYVALTETLPGEIHRLWSEGASVAEFDEVLAEWVDTHRNAVVLFRSEEGNR